MGGKPKNRQEPAVDEIREEMFRRLNRNSGREDDPRGSAFVPNNKGLTDAQVENVIMRVAKNFLDKHPELQLAVNGLNALILFFALGVALTVNTVKVLLAIGQGLYYSLGALAALATFVNIPVMYVGWQLGYDWVWIATLGSMFGWFTPALASFVHGLAFSKRYMLVRDYPQFKKGRLVYNIGQPDSFNRGMHRFFRRNHVAGVLFGRWILRLVDRFDGWTEEIHENLVSWWYVSIRLRWLRFVIMLGEMRRAVADLRFRRELLDHSEELEFLYGKPVFWTARLFHSVDQYFGTILPTAFNAFGNKELAEFWLEPPAGQSKTITFAAKSGLFIRHFVEVDVRNAIEAVERYFKRSE